MLIQGTIVFLLKSNNVIIVTHFKYRYHTIRYDTIRFIVIRTYYINIIKHKECFYSLYSNKGKILILITRNVFLFYCVIKILILFK